MELSLFLFRIIPIAAEKELTLNQVQSVNHHYTSESWSTQISLVIFFWCNIIGADSDND